MMKVVIFVCMLFCSLVGSASNDSLYVRRITDTLASPAFLGRGYVNNGMQKAAHFIADEMNQIGLKVETQKLHFPVNVFAGKMNLTLNGKALTPGTEFIVGPNSKGIKSKGELLQQDSITYVFPDARVVIKLVEKLTWSVAQEQADYTTFQVLKTAANSPASFSCEVGAKLNKAFACENVMGTIKGSVNADSVLVFTAHYDHLGAMGEHTYFPGANDNAGGVALMLSMAKKFVQNPPPYTVVFIAFAAEEAGLVGSKYFVEHPLIDLKKISFLLNLDLMGNGEDGITVVNATQFPAAFSLLQKINANKNLLAAVNSRGKAANSDHYWFTEKGVPSFFIYTLGKRKDYHDVNDIAATVPWFEVNDLTTLLYEFAAEIMHATL
jgi:aminopeptidase YwaD